MGRELQDGGVGDESGGDEARSERAELVEAYGSASVSERFAGATRCRLMSSDVTVSISVGSQS